MKKLSCYLLLLAVMFCLPPYAASSCIVCDGAYNLQEGVAADSLTSVLNTELGNKMTGLVEDLGGNLQIDKGKTIRLPKVEAMLIPAGQKDGRRVALLLVDIKNKGSFLFAVESSAEPLDLATAYMKIYTASGKIISFKNFKLNFENANFAFQENDDINNSISILADNTLCLLLLIVGIFFFWPLLIIWAIYCL